MYKFKFGDAVVIKEGFHKGYRGNIIDILEGIVSTQVNATQTIFYKVRLRVYNNIDVVVNKNDLDLLNKEGE